MEALSVNKKYSRYLKAFIRTMKARIEDEEDKQLIIRSVFYGVKLINTLQEPKNYEEAVNNFQLASAIQSTAGLLTPTEFMSVFPIEKYYEGERFGDKDYYYTIGYIETLDKDKPIGEEITHFLWEYTNWEISFFNVAIMGLMSDIRRYEGKPSLAVEWASMNGIPMYTMHTDHTGNQFLIDKKGKTRKLRSSKPRSWHLKRIK